MEQPSSSFRFAMCIDNRGYEDDLKVRTVYRILSDDSAAQSQYLRVIDETGEDYLYPASSFVSIDIPKDLDQTLFDVPVIRRKRSKRTPGVARKKILV